MISKVHEGLMLKMKQQNQHMIMEPRIMHQHPGIGYMGDFGDLSDLFSVFTGEDFSIIFSKRSS